MLAQFLDVESLLMGYSFFTHITTGRWGEAYEAFFKDTQGIEGLHKDCCHIHLKDLEYIENQNIEEYFTILWLSEGDLSDLNSVAIMDQLSQREWLILVTDIEVSSLSLESRWFYDHISSMAETVLKTDQNVVDTHPNYFFALSSLMVRLNNSIKGMVCIDWADVHCTLWGYAGTIHLLESSESKQNFSFSDAVVVSIKASKTMVGLLCGPHISLDGFTEFGCTLEKCVDDGLTFALAAQSIEHRAFKFSPLLCMKERLSGAFYDRIY